jgi:hypothetical protein
MPRRKVYGRCHICGKDEKLSFEHVPPEKAFNSRPVVLRPFAEMLKYGLDDPQPRGEIQQRGMGGYTLCERCNTLTGHWYGNAFIEWCYQGLDILIRAEGRPSLIYLNHVLPLRVIKQVVTMFFSACGPEFRDGCEELVDFVLNPERRYLPPEFGFYVYYNIEGTYRYSSMATLVKLYEDRYSEFSEITFPPYGYVMTFDSPPPDPRLYSISHFARYDYDEFRTFGMKLPMLPTFLSMPGDYRTRDQIEIDSIKGKLAADRMAARRANAA